MSINNKRKILYNTSFYFLLSLSFIVIIYFVYLFSVRNVIAFDDVSNAFSHKDMSLYDYFIVNAYRGKILSSSIIKIVGYIIPLHFNIHPIYWIQTWGGIIRGICFAILSLYLTSFLFLKNKKNFLLPFALIFTYFFIQIKLFNTFQLELYSSFFCFTFPLLFLFLFWIKIYNLYFNNSDNVKKTDILSLIILAFITCFSTECCAIVNISSFLFYWIFGKSTFKLKNIPCFLILLSSILGAVLLFFHPEMTRPNLDVINFLPTYLKGLKYVLTHALSIYIIITFILIIIHQLMKNPNIKKINIFAFSLLFGIGAFILSLIFAGNFFEYPYVQHFDLLLEEKMIFIAVIYFLISSLKNKLLYYFSIITLCLLFIYFNFNYIYDGFVFFKDKNINFKNIREYAQRYVHNDTSYYELRYLNERLMAYYIYSKKKPTLILGDFVTNQWDIDLGYAWTNNCDYTKIIYGKHYDFDEIVFTYSFEEAYKQYLLSGGPKITQEELKKCDFQKLMNRNYILYGT